MKSILIIFKKTGILIDQCENHQRLAKLAKGKKILDLYTYHEGFALHGAKAGAEIVTAIISSKNAILKAKHNTKFNNIKWIEAMQKIT